MLLRASIIFIFFVALTARAAWVEAESRVEPSIVPGLEHQHLVVQDSESGNRAILELARFTPNSCKLRLIDNPDSNRSLAEAMEKTKCVSGVNGGYFDPNFAPLGLRIADGKLMSPLVRGRLLSGILVSSENGVRIVRTGEFSRKQKASMALECGPFLVDGGQRVAGLEKTRSARRTFAAIGRSDQVALGVCSEVSLAELSGILAQGLGSSKIQRALNFDGGSSTAFWFKRKAGDPVSIPEEKFVRDFIGIVAK
jgi:exopolysaccharide biosynthesis protein